MADLIRSFPLDAEEVDVVGRRLEGLALRWDNLYKVTDDGGKTWYEEGFRRGSCEDSIRSRRNTFESRSDHRDERIGLVAFTEADEGLAFIVRLDSTDEGDRELDLLRSERHRGVSIRYTPMRNTPRSGPPWWRAKVELRELSLTDQAQYHDARVMAIRSHEAVSADRPTRWERPADIGTLLDYKVPSL
jgi:HK97 family phage prohead protease